MNPIVCVIVLVWLYTWFRSCYFCDSENYGDIFEKCIYDFCPVIKISEQFNLKKALRKRFEHEKSAKLALTKGESLGTNSETQFHKKNRRDNIPP